MFGLEWGSGVECLWNTLKALSLTLNITQAKRLALIDYDRSFQNNPICHLIPLATLKYLAYSLRSTEFIDTFLKGQSRHTDEINT